MWFRRDLRLADNPALLEACADGPVLPLFVLDPALWGPSGPVRRAYLARLAARPEPATCRSRWSAATRYAAWCWPPRRSAPSGCTSPPTSAPTARPATRPSERALAEAGIELVRTGSPYAVAPGRVLTGERRARSRCSRRSPAPGPTTAGGARSTAPRSAELARPRRHHRDPRPGPARGPRAARRQARRPRCAAGATSSDRVADYDEDRDQPGRRRHLADVRAPEVGRDPPADAARRPGAAAQQGRGDLPHRAGLAGVLRRRAARPARAPPATTTAPSSRRMRYDEPGPALDAWRRGPHRLPDRRRRDAPAAPRPAGCTTGCG